MSTPEEQPIPYTPQELREEASFSGRILYEGDVFVNKKRLLATASQLERAFAPISDEECVRGWNDTDEAKDGSLMRTCLERFLERRRTP